MKELILNYQTVDGKLLQLEKQLSESESKKVFQKMQSFVKEIQIKSTQLEQKAKELFAEYEATKKEFDKNFETAENLSKTNAEEVSENQIEDYITKLNNVSSNLSQIEKNLMSQADRINKLLIEFEQTKKQYNVAKVKYKENKEKYEELEKQLLPEITKIKKELTVLEKEIDKNLLAKYKTLRQDNLFPVFVNLVQKTRCGGCSMELSYAQISSLKNKGYTECENCHRIIFFE